MCMSFFAFLALLLTRCWFQILLFAGPFLRWFPMISPNAPASLDILGQQEAQPPSPQRCMRLVLWLCCWVTTGAGPQPRVWVQNLGMNTRPQCQVLFKFWSSATQWYSYIWILWQCGIELGGHVLSRSLMSASSTPAGHPFLLHRPSNAAGIFAFLCCPARCCGKCQSLLWAWYDLQISSWFSTTKCSR